MREFGTGLGSYGRLHPVTIGGQPMKLLPLVHPKQAGSLGAAAPVWTKINAGWVAAVARGVLETI